MNERVDFLEKLLDHIESISWKSLKKEVYAFGKAFKKARILLVLLFRSNDGSLSWIVGL